MRINKVMPIKTPPYCNSRQTLPERVKWLRVRQQPFMTQAQLSQLSGVQLQTIIAMEKGDMKAMNMKLSTLRRIAHALGCQVYINIKSRSSPISTECQPL